MKEIGRLTGVDFDGVLLTEFGRRSIRDGAPVVIVPDQQSEKDQEDHLECQQKPRKHQLLQLRERHAATHPFHTQAQEFNFKINTGCGVTTNVRTFQRAPPIKACYITIPSHLIQEVLCSKIR